MQEGVLGVAQATDSFGGDQVGQTNLQLETDMLPMNSSQNDSADHADSVRGMEPEQAIASFEVPVPDTGREIFVMPAEKPDPASPGARLRAAREARSMDLEQAASRLRLPQRLLQALEADDNSRIDHGVYQRGYLVRYARLLGLPAGEFARNVEMQRETPTLVATGKISHSRYLYERYSLPAVYVLLTGLIVGPSVWLATHGGLEHNLTRFAPLDTPAETTPPATTASVASHPVAPAGPVSTEPPSSEAISEAASIPPVEEPADPAAKEKPAKPADQPLMASLAPFPAMPAAAPAKPVEAAPAPGTHRLHLKLSEASWVEIIGDDGHKLEFGLLPAGAERDYASAAALSVRLGNATGAVVVVDGKSLDLTPYRRSNVAYFRAFGAKTEVAPVEN